MDGWTLCGGGGSGLEFGFQDCVTLEKVTDISSSGHSVTTVSSPQPGQFSTQPLQQLRTAHSSWRVGDGLVLLGGLEIAALSSAELVRE